MPFAWGRKQEFGNDEPVILYKLGFDGEYKGKIKGKSFLNAIDSYIVELDPEAKRSIRNEDGSLPYKWDCISITEACLRRPDDCNCWHSTNVGVHPSGFNCEHCGNTGRRIKTGN